MNITNKVVLITGANRGIGLALVEEALKRGAKKVYAGTRVAMKHPDNRVVPLVLDVTNIHQIASAAARIEELDVLINNAGVLGDTVITGTPRYTDGIQSSLAHVTSATAVLVNS